MEKQKIKSDENNIAISGDTMNSFDGDALSKIDYKFNGKTISTTSLTYDGDQLIRIGRT